MLSEFIRNLLEGRPIGVGQPNQLDDFDLEDALRELHSFEANWQSDLPGDPPRFDPDAALWAAKSLYTASSLLIHRDFDAQQIDQLLSDPPPDRSLVESHYSVDLIMRFLPDLVRLANAAASNDPLVAHLTNWATMWPLSSVGSSKQLDEVDAGPLRTSPTMMRLYVDRIVAYNDTSRLTDPAVRELADAMIGNYPELNSAIADVLRPSPIPSDPIAPTNEHTTE